MLRIIFFILALACVVQVSAQRTKTKSNKKTQDLVEKPGTIIEEGDPYTYIKQAGAGYIILSHHEGDRKVTAKDAVVLMNMHISVESTDSVMLETFSTNEPRYLPLAEPSLGGVLKNLSKNDSASIIVPVDSFFNLSFSQPAPSHFKKTEHIRLLVKVVDVFTEAELEEKGKADLQERSFRDSLAVLAYTESLKNVKTTASGLKYIVNQNGTGRLPVKGDMVTVKYKGYFADGKVFDENQQEGLAFMLGEGHVIKGWDEGIALMNEGAKYKLIIPWNLAYGLRGQGTIPPVTSLIFDVELVSIK